MTLAAAASRIERVVFGATRRTLTRPYVLSFGTVREVRSAWFMVRDGAGRTGLGEAVPLAGYADDSLEDILAGFEALRGALEGAWPDQALAALRAGGPDAAFAASASRPAATPCVVPAAVPFALSAAATALEFLAEPQRWARVRSLALVWPLDASSGALAVGRSMDRGAAGGYRHFKMKVGHDPAADAAVALDALGRLGPGMSLRFDANQGYDAPGALAFCGALGGCAQRGALWLEQPLAPDAWVAMAALCAATDFPLMLDESIYGEDDVRRAAAIGCRAVKLKLFKHPGMGACLDLARLAGELGLLVTLGNGVATEVGNLAEALVASAAPELFVPGAECNGFVKLDPPSTLPGLREVGGKLAWAGGEFFAGLGEAGPGGEGAS